jgi:hypothetical protein
MLPGSQVNRFIRVKLVVLKCKSYSLPAGFRGQACFSVIIQV